MADSWSATDRLGILNPAIDAHKRGVTSVAGLLEECECAVSMAPEEVCRAARPAALPQTFPRQEEPPRLASSSSTGP